MKLLIAEDEDMIRNGMEKYIRLHTDRFEQIYLARNGQEAIDIIFEKRPEMMLLDIQMPGKDGIDVMKEAKEAEILPAKIILSGYEEFKYAQQALYYGARCYLLKPSRSSDILRQITEIADEIAGVTREHEEEDTRSGIAARAKEYVDEHYSEELTLQRVADAIGISPGYLSTSFSQFCGKGFVDYLNQVRIEHACAYLRLKYFKTYEIAYKVGYKDEKYFTRVFKKVMGVPPNEYKKNNG